MYREKKAYTDTFYLVCSEILQFSKWLFGTDFIISLFALAALLRYGQKGRFNGWAMGITIAVSLIICCITFKSFTVRLEFENSLSALLYWWASISNIFFHFLTPDVIDYFFYKCLLVSYRLFFSVFTFNYSYWFYMAFFILSKFNDSCFYANYVIQFDGFHIGCYNNFSWRVW